MSRTSGTAAVVAPSRQDPLVARLSVAIGGPAGSRRAPYRGLLQAVVVLCLLAVAVLGAGVVLKQHCRAQGWTDPDQFFHACYSDIPLMYATAAGDGQTVPGLTGTVAGLGEAPVVGAVMWVVAQAVGPGPQGQQALQYFDLSVLVLAVALTVAVALLAAATPRRPWDAAHLALSPIVLLSALVSYDLVAVVLVAASLLAWSRGRAVAAGVLLGLSVAAAPVYAVLAVALLALAVRTARWAPVLTTTGTALAVWLVVRLLLLPGWTGGLGEAWGAWRDAQASFGSLWWVPELLARSRPRAASSWLSSGLPPTAVTALALLGVIVVCFGTVLLALAPARRPRLAHLALFAVAGVLLVSKAVPPQAAVLLLPLVALAGLRWRDHLVWASAEASYFVGVWLYLAATRAPDRGLTAAFYAILLLLRSAGLVWLMVCAVRAARSPDLDLVRADGAVAARRGPVDVLGADDTDFVGDTDFVDDAAPADDDDLDDDPEDDPHAGPIAGSPDALVVRLA